MKPTTTTHDDERLSLHPLTFEEALDAAVSVDPRNLDPEKGRPMSAQPESLEPAEYDHIQRERAMAAQPIPARRRSSESKDWLKDLEELAGDGTTWSRPPSTEQAQELFKRRGLSQ